MFDLFMNDGFPEAVILDQNMTVFGLPPDFDINYISNQLQTALDNCTECNDALAGDVNSDNAVDILDVVLTVNMILSGEYLAVADLNNDGSVDVLDVVLIIGIILG